MVTFDSDIRIVAFDLDGTLAQSPTSVPPRMAALLRRLMREVDVCVVSGGSFDRLREQVVAPVEDAAEGENPVDLVRLHLMPVNGTHYHRWYDGSWHEVYDEEVPVGDVDRVSRVLIGGAKALGLWDPHHVGDVIQDRGSQITYSALGTKAPLEARLAWDPDGSKKESLRAYAAERLPDLEVLSGGATAVDVTRKGVDKSYGMHRLMDRLDLDRRNVMFVGDRLDAHGNDRPVLAMGIRCVAVTNWADTAALVERWLKDGGRRSGA
jgi:phosphomannomutase